VESLLAEAGGRRRLVSVTSEVEIDDPAAAVFASRLAGDRWFCWEQPDRDGFAIAALGSAHEVVSRGADRFTDAVAECAEISVGQLSDAPPSLPAGTGPIWTGGFAFAPDGGRSPHWSSFPPALMVLPELSLHRRAGRTHLTVCAMARPDGEWEATLARLRARLGALREASLPMLEPHATGEVRITSALPPEHFERTVAQAVGRIRAGALEKVVLAREVLVEAPRAHDPAALYGALRELFPSCFCFCCGSPEGAFMAASPELLVRRDGAGAATVALAGSARRSADPAVDDHLGEQLLRSDKDREEQAIVTRRIVRALRPFSVWVTAADEPVLARMANIQHLATPIRAQLAQPVSAVELAGLLHPTPAVGGEPFAAAAPLIPALEGLDRGWYAGPVGWTDANEDGEFCVALRCALIAGSVARCYAGVGVVRDSDPSAELAETEVKLQALLPVLAA
jgi:salicylate biosynthesis isochorismate synthase